MDLTGLTLRNAHTGMIARIVDANTQEGRGFTIEYTVPVGAPKTLIDPHLHQHWNETFEVLSGEGRYRLGRAEAGLTAKESVTLPSGVPHLHPWNVGQEPLRVRQTTTFSFPDPTAVRDTIEAFAMLSWLANEGKVDSRGRPGALQGALILRKLQRHGGFLAGAPIPVQRVLFGALAALAERRGYVEFDPRCLAS